MMNNHLHNNYQYHHHHTIGGHGSRGAGGGGGGLAGQRGGYAATLSAIVRGKNNKKMKRQSLKGDRLTDSALFRCVHASLFEGLSVRWSVRPFVRP